MTKCKIEMILKNGERLEGYIKTNEPDSDALLNKLLYNTNGELYDFVGILDMTDKHNIIIRVSEIAVIDISIIRD